jgi:uncharacterized OsmC-like protein
LRPQNQTKPKKIMKISAHIASSFDKHETTVETNNAAKQIHIAPKSTGYGSSINGGELLMLALATCFCNDIYREAAKKNIAITSVQVEASADFGAEGETGKNFTCKANVIADADPRVIEELIRHTDQVAEIHNTLRKGVSVSLIS